MTQQARKTNYSTASENGMEFICNRWVFTGDKGYRVKANDDGTFRVVSYTAAGERAVWLGPESDRMAEDAAHELAASLAKLPVHPKVGE